MNSVGRIFRLSIFGESHGPGVGIVIDGVPAGIALNSHDFKSDIDRRRPRHKGTTKRQESDVPVFNSGLYKGFSTGGPIGMWFENANVRSQDYTDIRSRPRPCHADWVADRKFGGFNDPTGGGHFSGRLTLPLVAAGVIAKKIISPIEISAQLTQAGGDTNIEAALDRAIAEGDSIGGLVECVARSMPVGIGEPFFDALESRIAQLIFAIPAVKGIAFGSGFAAAGMQGSEHNDAIIDDSGTTATNHAGGINGGISNGNPLVFSVAFKPSSSIPRTQRSFDFRSQRVEEMQIVGRHDACIAIRAVVVVEAALAIALADLLLIHGTLKVGA